MATKQDLINMRGRIPDNMIMETLYSEDVGFRATVDKHRVKMPELSAFAKSKFPTAVLNKHYLGSYEVGIAPKTNTTTNIAQGMINTPASEAQKITDFQASSFVGRTLQNIPGSAVQFGGDILGAIKGIFTGETLGALGDLATGGAVNTVETIAGFAGVKNAEDLFDVPSEQVASAVGQFFGERYGSPEAIVKTLEEDPVGFAADLAGILSVVGVGARVAGTVGRVGAISKAGKAAVRAGELVDPLLTAGRVAKAPIKVVSKLKKTKPLAGQLDDVIGTIVQGEKADIPRARRALSQLDTTQVKTFEELNNVIQENVRTLSGKQGELLSADKVPKTVKELTRTKKVGKRTVKSNSVEDSLNQLEELYTKINQPEDVARIQNVRDVLNDTGLPLKELNDLSIEYGVEFGSKGFSARTGEPLTSVNARSFENTRKGIKETVRGFLKDDSSKAIDAGLTDLLRTRTLITKLERDTGKLSQKLVSRGLIEKLGRTSGRFANAISFGGPRAFIASFFPSGFGKAQLSSVDLQGILNKNLRKAQRLSKAIDGATDAEAVSLLQRAFSPSITEPLLLQERRQ